MLDLKKKKSSENCWRSLWGGEGVIVLLPLNLCMSFTYQARSEIFASTFSSLISSHLACSARPRASHGFLCRRGGNLLLPIIA